MIVTGTHLSNTFGRTIDAILADGFSITTEIAMDLDASDGFATARASAQVLHGMADAMEALRPDMLLVLGDRFEILAAVQAAYLARVPVAHIHGGEVTTGAFDDGIRHAITKLARLHLTSTETHRSRVLQLGEDPEWVHVVGAPGLENLHKLSLVSKTAFEKRVGMSLGKPAVLLTFHSATAVCEDASSSMEVIFRALDAFPEASIIATGSNTDPGSRDVMAVLESATRRFGDRLVIHESLGVDVYLSALTHCDLILGNSSSGIIEAPSAGIPTVNVGARQDGRPRAASVIDCLVEVDEIRDAIERSQNPTFRALAARRKNPYAGYSKDIGQAIADKVLLANLDGLHAAKPFFDLDVPH